MEKESEKKTGKKSAPAAVLGAGCLWGSMGLFVRLLNRSGFQTMNIVFLRAVITASVLLAALLLFKRQTLRVRWKDLWCFAGTGIASVVFFNFCYFRTIEKLSMSVAAVLLYTAPAFVLVISAVLFHEKITKRKVISLILTVAGCALVSGVFAGGGPDSLDLPDLLIGIGAGVGYALYSIFSKLAIKRGYGSLTITFYTFLFAAFGCFLIPGSDAAFVFQNIIHSGWQMAGFVILFSLVTTVIPYFLYTLGLRGMDNSKASVIATVEPAVASLIGIFVFREQPGILQLVGILAVLGGVILSAS